MDGMKGDYGYKGDKGMKGTNGPQGFEGIEGTKVIKRMWKFQNPFHIVQESDTNIIMWSKITTIFTILTFVLIFRHFCSEMVGAARVYSFYLNICCTWWYYITYVKTEIKNEC